MTSVVVFVYPEALTFSGQTAATVVAMRELRSMGWECRPVEFTALDRSQSLFPRYLRFGLGVLRAWVRLAIEALRGHPSMVFSHGQTVTSLLRMGLPHLVFRRLSPHSRIVTSLHGSVFMGWDRDSLRMRFFLRLLHASNAITVLGSSQRNWLIGLGVPADRLVVLPNTADLTFSSEESVRAKHEEVVQSPDAPLVLMHLSLLIESKGFVEFLEACHSFAVAEDRSARPIEVRLVGPISFDSYCPRFPTCDAKRSWIASKIAALNALPNTSARWIEGAQGHEKRALFEAAHVFIFPSRFPVEAQPLVLIEAMASGCALVASNQGEIPSTMGRDTGFCLGDVSVDRLGEAIRVYVEEHDRRLAAGLAARVRAAQEFSTRKYGENWRRLLTGQKGYHT